MKRTFEKVTNGLVTMTTSKIEADGREIRDRFGEIWRRAQRSMAIKKSRREVAELKPIDEGIDFCDVCNSKPATHMDEHKILRIDPVARLYRTVELIAHYRLKRGYEIDPQRSDPSMIPKELWRRWSVTGEEPIKLSLKMSYELLEVERDILGERFIKDMKMQGLLSRRNQSILAHGINPINKKTFNNLLEKTIEYSDETVKDLKQLMEDSQFIKWKY